MSVPKSRRLYRPISVSAVPAGPSIDIWRSCRFLGAMLRALGDLPDGLGRFLPCRIGAKHCRLRSIGWERCGHGLTSRPLEASGAVFLDDLLSLFGYPGGSGQSLVDGSLRMRYCSANFSHKKPTWGLPHSGGVAALVDTASFRPTVAGFRGPGNILGVRTFGKIERRYDSPNVFRGVVSHGQSVGVVHYGVGSYHLGEPMGIG